MSAIERDAKGYVVIARTDVKKPQDLVGKPVATRVGSTGSWFISEWHRISRAAATFLFFCPCKR